MTRRGAPRRPRRASPAPAGIRFGGAEGADPRREANRAPASARAFAALGADDAYRRVALAPEHVGGCDERFEVWERATRTAWEVRETSPFHELPSQRLATLAERISVVRGRPIQCFGTMSLTLLNEAGEPAQVMRADQSLYLHPRRANIVGPEAMVVGRNHYPDVVLEVDRTTDVRRHKLALYQAWGFPEVWVEVPDGSPRPRDAWGTTIHILEAGAYRAAEESAALPGWRAAEIHQALNEESLSAQTVAVLERLGAALGARDGSGPEDDPLLGPMLSKARRAAFEGELGRRAAMVRRIMKARGLQVAEDFPLGARGFADAAPETAVDAALRCAGEADFLARLGRTGPATRRQRS